MVEHFEGGGSIAGYIRVSSDNADTLGSVAAQKEAYRGMYKFVDLEGTWLSGAFSVLNRRVDKGIVAS